MTYDIDILIISSSRPDVLKYCMESFNKKLLNCNKTYYVNEDVTNRKKSIEVCNILKKYNIKNINKNFGKKRLGPLLAINHFIKNNCTSKYCFILEDDWELLLDIDVSELVNIMENNSHVNQLIFKFKDKFIGDEVDLNSKYKFKLSISPQACPSLWRTSKLIQCYEDCRKKNMQIKKSGLLMRSIFDGYSDRKNQYINNKLNKAQFITWLSKNCGSYIFLTQFLQIRHLGTTWKTLINKPNLKTTYLKHELHRFFFIYWNLDYGYMPVRPINGKIPYDTVFEKTNLPFMFKKLKTFKIYIQYIKDLKSNNYLEDSVEWDKFLSLYGKLPDICDKYNIKFIYYNSNKNKTNNQLVVFNDDINEEDIDIKNNDIYFYYIKKGLENIDYDKIKYKFKYKEYDDFILLNV